MVKIRKATTGDIERITEIYNEAIIETVATFDTKKKTINEQETWFKNHGKKNPILVAEEKGIVIGFASLSKYSTRCAYSDTAELSLYIKKEHQDKGHGKKLMGSIITEGKKACIHTIISRITQGNEKSVYLHKFYGFEDIGIFKEAGKKFDKILDVYLMQKIYK